MAQYRLIIKDDIYFKLLAIASKLNLSVGKLLNNLIEEYVKMEYNKHFGEKVEAKES